jgi:hypothetical protein
MHAFLVFMLLLHTVVKPSSSKSLSEKLAGTSCGLSKSLKRQSHPLSSCSLLPAGA